MKIILLLAFFVFCSADEANPSWQNNIFDWKLINSTLQGKSENVVISPFSIKLLLSLLSHASATKTKEEIQNTVLPYKVEKDIPIYFINILRDLKPIGTNYILDIVSSILIDENEVEEPRKAFLDGAKHYYNSDILKLNLTRLNETLDYLNNYFANITHGHIKDVLNEDDLMDVLVLLTNVIYFQGTWEYVFNETFNYNERFYLNKNNLVEVTYMTQINDFNFTFYNDDIIMMELPYHNSEISMHLILPRNSYNIDDIINNLDAKSFEAIKNDYELGNVIIHLPKFNFTFESHLKENLENLGITTVFTDFAEIVEFKPHNLKVKDFIHKAGIEVNEKGTTASAVSVIPIADRITPPTIKFNRPFAFLIEDKKSGAIIFAGKVINPLK